MLYNNKKFQPIAKHLVKFVHAKCAKLTCTLEWKPMQGNKTVLIVCLTGVVSGASETIAYRIKSCAARVRQLLQPATASVDDDAVAAAAAAAAAAPAAAAAQMLSRCNYSIVPSMPDRSELVYFLRWTVPSSPLRKMLLNIHTLLCI